ncbi:MAG: STAS domain-containing protein [Candidatus Muiribacteriaceae bacterium]
MFKLDVDRKNDVLILRPQGDLDYNFELEIKERMEESLSEPVNTVIDLSEVSYIDSVGISIMTYMKQELKKKGFELYFYNPVDSIRKVFKMTRLDHYIPIIEDKEKLQEMLEGK